MSNLTIKEKGLDILEIRIIKMLNGQIRDIRNKAKNRAKHYSEEKMPKVLDKNS